MRATRGKTRIVEVDQVVGAVVRRMRVEVGLPQKEMAARLGVTYQQLHKYETAVNRVSVSMLRTIADALGTTVEAMMAAIEAELGSPSKTPPATTAARNARFELYRVVDRLTDVRDLKLVCELAAALDRKGPRAAGGAP